MAGRGRDGGPPEGVESGERRRPRPPEHTRVLAAGDNLYTPSAAANLGIMPVRTDTFDLGGLHLSSGAGRRLELFVSIDQFVLGGERYRAQFELVPVQLDVSRTTGNGYALRLRFTVGLSGPCMRCLEPATPAVTVESREVSQPRDAEEQLDSPYLEGEVLDLRAWARDALALSLPAKLLCRPDCAGLCPVCGANMNAAGAEHGHESAPDPRWARLSDIRFE
jgi:uncharacterized protein